MKTSTSTRLFVSLLILMFFFFAVAAASAQVTPSDDTYTLTTSPATNYGTNGGLQVQSGKATVFVRFDLSSIPPGYTSADIAKATLKLYVNSVGASGSFNVDYVVGSWSEATATATLEPAIGTVIASGINVSTANKGGYILVDVTPALDAWLDGSQANEGIALVGNSPLNVIFCSKENTVVSHSPELDIVFTGTGPRGPQGFAGTTGPAGAQGPIGPTGATGTQGPVGKTGAVGTKGPVGPAGPQGATGATGTPGPVGATGAQGSVGLTGAQGPQGAQGTTGTNGTGFTFRNGFDPTPQYAVDDVVTWNGSTYVAIAANGGPNNLMPDTNPSAWTLMARQGGAGATGSQGPSGTTGATGPQGPAGTAGSQGAIGPQGSTGGIGATGPQGPIGLTGAQGVQGAAGTNGTGFDFRGAFNPSTAYAINDVVTYAPANITYNVSLVFGSAGSMVGTITTDGTIGVLSTSNIVSWHLTLADSPTNSTLLTPSNSAFSSGNFNTGGQPNSNFSATPTNLTFTYANGGSWGVSGASGQFCMTDWSNCFGPIGYGTWGINGDGMFSDSSAGGSQVIGTGGTVATPITSTYVATAPIAAGAATPGTLPWAMMAQAGGIGAASTVPGPAGSQGPAGPIGLTGATGATGAQGSTGAIGATGPQGLMGATGPQGPIGFTGVQGTPGTNGTGFNWTGPWNSTTNYNVNDVVTFSGASYVAVLAGANQEPDLTSTASSVNFLLTDPIGVDGQYGPLTWTLPVAPTAQDLAPGQTFSSFGNGFEITNILGSWIPGGSRTWYMNVLQPSSPSSVGISFAIVSGGGGYNAIEEYGPQIWLGSSAAPTFVPGTYQMSNVNGGAPNSATLVVTPAGLIYWNLMAQAGTVGTAGATGATGPQGPVGAAGSVGATGPQGPIGLTGATGPQGLVGATGGVGATGAQGPIGLTGATGPQGPPPTTYVNATGNHAPVSGSNGISSPGVIHLTNIPPGSYFVTGNVNLSYGIDPLGHRYVNPWCDLYASDGGGGLMNMGQSPWTTMDLPFTADLQTTAYATLTVSGWVNLTSSMNLIYIGCSINGPWDTTTLSTITQTLTAVQSTVVKSPGSMY